MSPNLFAHLRGLDPPLIPSVASKKALAILCRQLEDLLRDAPPGTILVAGFQEHRQWAAAAERYTALPVDHVVALVGAHADGDEPPAPLLRLAPEDPLAQDWFLVTLGPDHGAALCARDLGLGPGPEGGRLFECVFSTDQQVVRGAVEYLRGALARRAPARVAGWPAPGEHDPLQPAAARTARQNEQLITGLFGEIEALRQREHSARRAAERLHAQGLDAARHERRRLAQTLHDDSLQYLLAAHQDLLEFAAGRRAVPDADLDACVKHLAHGLTHLRAAVSAIQPLRPAADDLSAILRLMASELGDRGGFEAVVSVDAAADASPRGPALLPIVRELLTNTVKHAGAARVTVGVRRRDGVLVLDYSDDGIGFDTTRLSRSRAAGHIGLTILDDRLRALGATSELETAPGTGLRFRATVPEGVVSGVAPG